MHDLIYRQEAIDAMHQYSYFNDFDVSVIDEDIAVIALKDLSSAQPYTDEEIQKMQDIEQAQLYKAYEMGNADALRWIPCDKGEPDEDMECWVTVKTTDALYRGNFTKRYGERRDKGFITSGGFMWWNTALAWMPIYEPEPYRGEAQN